MADRRLRTYLRDHYAGSSTALRTAQRCFARNRGNVTGAFAQRLVGHIHSDRALLREVMDRAGARPDRIQSGMGRVSAAASRLKLRGVLGSRPVTRIEELEALTLGAAGRAALWQALDAGCADDLRFEGLDFAGRARRANEDLQTLEHLRRRAAADAFGRAKPASAAQRFATDLG